MNTQEKIKHLFYELNIDEQNLILEEHHKLYSFNNKPVNDTVVESCPYCSSVVWSKNGHQGIKQRYKCKACHKIFTSVSGSCFHSIKKMNKFDGYRKLMFEQYYTIQTMAKKIGISVQTSFDWRHKILSSLNSEDNEFNGITEIDDVWFLYSQKGRKGLKYS